MCSDDANLPSIQRSGFNFINVLQAAFTCTDPISAKKTVKSSSFFALSGSASVKAAHRTLMKLTPGVNFTNKLQSAFAPVFFCQKIQNRTISREKLLKIISYEKAVHKMLVKLTCTLAFKLTHDTKVFFSQLALFI